MKFKISSKSIALFMALTITTTSLFGCGVKEDSPKKDVKTESQSNESSSKENKKSDVVEITDHAGRKVEIPSADELESVYYTSPIGLIFAYTMDSNKLAGSPTPVDSKQSRYLTKLEGLEELGGMHMGGELNKEAIINSGAQLILSIGPGKIDDASKEEADLLQEQLGIPVIIVSGIFDEIDKTYELLGKIYGKEERARDLSDYCKGILADVEERLKDIKEEEKIKVYYSEGQDGLSTEPSGSGHSVVLDYAKADNVAKIDAKPGSGMTPVSIEQIIEWNPELILSWSDARGGAYSLIKESEVWKEISAVQNEAVYSTPDLPFTWIDRPPSVNRYLGLQWLANLLYPEKYDIDIVKITQDFCKKFYDIDLSEEDVNEILKTSLK